MSRARGRLEASKGLPSRQQRTVWKPVRTPRTGFAAEDVGEPEGVRIKCVVVNDMTHGRRA